jgi:hypothetical protein
VSERAVPFIASPPIAAGDEEVFLSDKEIAQRWNIGEKTARIAMAALEKHAGFPRKDPLFGNRRYWPAVCNFMRKRAGLLTKTSQKEAIFDEDQPAKNRQRSRSSMAPAR